MISKQVLVTGGNGHLGAHLVATCLERGHRVRATLRDPTDRAKAERLRSLGAEVVRADLFDASSWRAACEGMDVVLHSAAVFDTTARNPQEDLRRPNIEGTQHVLSAAAEAGVRRFVLTSSVAAVGTTRPGEAPLTEANWNTRAFEPYAISKRDAERAAWRFAAERGVDLVAILPATMLGPGFARHTPATSIVRSAMSGAFPVVPAFSFAYVDVRDVALAHALVAESEQASGRYIASGPTMSVRALLATLHDLDPSIRVPRWTAPPWLMRMLPVFDWLEHLIKRKPRQLVRAVVREYANRVQHFESQRLRDAFGWTTRPVRSTLEETMIWIRALERGTLDHAAQTAPG